MKTLIVEKVEIRPGTRRELEGSRNTYWRDLPPDAQIRDTGGSYVTADGSLIFWHGHEAREAQAALKRLHEAQPLPAFRVTRSDGTSYVTSMSPGTTLETARAYFVGQRFTDESADGTETVWTATAVEAAAAGKELAR